MALSIEALLLWLAVPLFRHGLAAGAVCAALACGLQNAMATTYSGAVVRTTHVSGMFTDLGIMLGHALRGMPLARRRLGLCMLVISFFAGGLLGARLFARFDYAALYLPPPSPGSPASATCCTGTGKRARVRARHERRSAPTRAGSTRCGACGDQFGMKVTVAT